MELLLPIILVVALVGLVALLIYLIMNYRKVNMLRFLILICLCVMSSFAQSDIDFNDPIIDDVDVPSPIILPEIPKACTVVEIELSGVPTTSEIGDFEDDWQYVLNEVNNTTIMKVNNSTIIAF